MRALGGVLFLMLAGCAGVTGGATYEPLQSRAFDAPLNVVMAATEKALLELGLEIKSKDVSGAFVASKGPGGDFVARKVTVTLKSDGNRTLVGVESESSSASPFYNARGEGYNREVLNLIAGHVKEGP